MHEERLDTVGVGDGRTEPLRVGVLGRVGTLSRRVLHHGAEREALPQAAHRLVLRHSVGVDGAHPALGVLRRIGVREDLVEHIDLAAMTLGAGGLEVPSWMQGRDILAKDYEPRSEVFAARDRCDETVEKIRSLRTDRFLYIRNFHPQRPHLQPNRYKDGKDILKALRAGHEAGTLPAITEELLFSPTRPVEELYDTKADPWQNRNLAGDPAHAATLADLRARLDAKLVATKDPGPESEAMYDSDMAEYLKKGDSVIEANIALMKQWAAEGK